MVRHRSEPPASRWVTSSTEAQGGGPGRSSVQMRDHCSPKRPMPSSWFPKCMVVDNWPVTRAPASWICGMTSAARSRLALTLPRGIPDHDGATLSVAGEGVEVGPEVPHLHQLDPRPPHVIQDLVRPRQGPVLDDAAYAAMRAHSSPRQIAPNGRPPGGRSPGSSGAGSPHRPSIPARRHTVHQSPLRVSNPRRAVPAAQAAPGRRTTPGRSPTHSRSPRDPSAARGSPARQITLQR